MIKKLLIPYTNNSKLVRLGPTRDGGYVVDEQALLDSEALFTYGVGPDHTWEVDYAKRFPEKKAFMFDHTVNVDPSTLPANLTFKKEGVSSVKGEQVNTFAAHLEEFGFTKKNKIFLKVDIEGAEYDFFLNTPLELFENVTGIVIEFHWVHEVSYNPKFCQVIERLSDLFYVTHLHGNNHAHLFNWDGIRFPWTPEVTLANKKMIPAIAPKDVSFPIDGLDYPNAYFLPDLKFKIPVL
jgi:hypothetical protein